MSDWHEADGLRTRAYQSYQSYLDHQASKLQKLNLARRDAMFRQEFAVRIRDLEPVRRGASVLCLGARTGAECEAFVECGCFAIGIDLNPGEGNRFVVNGDFHQLQFADRSIDIVYTNALDHAFEFQRIINEIARVLTDAGAFLAEIVRGSKDADGRQPGDYEAAWWDRADAPIERIRKLGFTLTARRSFTMPLGTSVWEQCLFLKGSDTAG